MANECFFTLGDTSQGLARKLSEGITTRIFFGENVMISAVEVAPNVNGAVHSHPEEQWGYLIEGACIRVQGGRDYPVKAGDLWYTPANVPHGVRTGAQRAVILDIFSPPRKAYKTEGEGFGT